jgi:hypothetical protein
MLTGNRFLKSTATNPGHLTTITMIIWGIFRFLQVNTLLTTYRANQITWKLNSLTLHTAVVSTVRSLLGSGRHGKAVLYLFQKHLLYWELENIFYRNEAMRQCFWNIDKTFGAASAVFPPLPACLFTPALEGNKLSDEDSTKVFLPSHSIHIKLEKLSLFGSLRKE